MKVVIIGGSGLIGRQVASLLRDRRHIVIAASRDTGVNALTGEGLAPAMHGAQVVVDVINSPSFEDKAVLEFFETEAPTVTRAASDAGVKRYIALSVVGADRAPDSGYMRAKAAQERLIKASGVPYTIVRATQFFEFAGAIAQSGAQGNTVRLPHALMQPMASADVAEQVAAVVDEQPRNGVIDIAGPESIPMDDLARRYLRATKSPLQVTTDPTARYFGELVNDQSLRPLGAARLGRTRFDTWLATAAK